MAGGGEQVGGQRAGVGGGGVGRGLQSNASAAKGVKKSSRDEWFGQRTRNTGGGEKGISLCCRAG